jgi:hypothetical protein
MSELVSLGKHLGFRVKWHDRVRDAVEASSIREEVSPRKRRACYPREDRRATIPPARRLAERRRALRSEEENGNCGRYVNCGRRARERGADLGLGRPLARAHKRATPLVEEHRAVLVPTRRGGGLRANEDVVARRAGHRSVGAGLAPVSVNELAVLRANLMRNQQEVG